MEAIIAKIKRLINENDELFHCHDYEATNDNYELGRNLYNFYVIDDPTKNIIIDEAQYIGKGIYFTLIDLKVKRINGDDFGLIRTTPVKSARH